MGARMESFESWHDAEEWGPLSSEDGELVSVPDLVRLQMLTPLPLVPAVHRVFDAIERDGSVNAYFTTLGDFALKVGAGVVWPDKLMPGSSITFGFKRPGTPGVMSYMRAYWTAKRRPRCLYDPVLGSYQLAILRKDADRLFGRDTLNPADVKTATPAVQSEPAAAPEQPAEPVWKDGDHWTPAAVAEMVRLHEQEGRSLSDIGRVMGERVGGPAISRQRVREKIPHSVRGGKGKCKGARG